MHNIYCTVVPWALVMHEQKKTAPSGGAYTEKPFTHTFYIWETCVPSSPGVCTANCPCMYQVNMNSDYISAWRTCFKLIKNFFNSVEVHVHCCQQPCWCATIISEVHVVITNFIECYICISDTNMIVDVRVLPRLVPRLRKSLGAKLGPHVASM